MKLEIRTLIVEDDPYSRAWMELLLRRDWRTKVMGEASDPTELSRLLADLRGAHSRLDLILVDTELPMRGGWLAQVLAGIAQASPNTPVLFTGVAPHPQPARLIAQPNFAGYILKNEIGFALAWAVTLAAEGHIVITPGVRDQFGSAHPLPAGALMLDGSRPPARFTERKYLAARLAFLFSMERRELADEMGIDEEYTYGLISELYEEMGLNDVLSGEVPAQEYFGTHPAVLAHLQTTLDALGGGRRGVKAKDKETLAFHLLTLPEITEIRGN